MRWRGTASEGNYDADLSPECRLVLDEVPTRHSEARRYRGFFVDLHLEGRFGVRHQAVRFHQGPCVAAEARRRVRVHLDRLGPSLVEAGLAHANLHRGRLSESNGRNLAAEEARLRDELSRIEADHDRDMATFRSEMADARRGLRDRTVVTGITDYPAHERSHAQRERNIAEMGAAATHSPAVRRYATETVRDWPDRPRLPERHHEILGRLKEIGKERERYGHAAGQEAEAAPEPRGPGTGW